MLCLVNYHADGVFDQRAYSEKALVRLTKAKAKAERTASKPNKSTGTDTPPTDENMESVAPKDPTSTMQDASARISSPSAIAELPSALAVIPPELRQSASTIRLSMLRSKPQLVNRFMGLIVPVLVEVYAASVALTIRTRTLTTLLKAFSFLESSALLQIAEASSGEQQSMSYRGSNLFRVERAHREFHRLHSIVRRSTISRRQRSSAYRASTDQSSI